MWGWIVFGFKAVYALSGLSGLIASWQARRQGAQAQRDSDLMAEAAITKKQAEASANAPASKEELEAALKDGKL